MPHQRESDTIAAIATAHGSGGIGIVRVSGPCAGSIAQQIVGKTLPHRVAVLSNFKNAKGDVLDQGVAIYFSGPASYTGEDVLELQGHGGIAILKLVLQSCIDCGARIANAGEFTLRAFLNGRMDLAQAESVADLIEAHTEEAARSALQSLRGKFSEDINSLVNQVIDTRVLIESQIDFPEEISSSSIPPVENLIWDLDRILDKARMGNLLRKGISVAIVGEPNVGKSSLINVLTDSDAAIVSHIPGTTRDVVRKDILIEGIQFHIMDTAGLRSTTDEIERIGIERSLASLEEAELILWVDAVDHVGVYARPTIPTAIPILKIINKLDLLEAQGQKEAALYISTRTGEGIHELKQAMLNAVGWHNSIEAGGYMARERHLLSLGDARNHLKAAQDASFSMEISAEELRLAQRALNTITGAFGSEDLLGEIFSRFCLGK